MSESVDDVIEHAEAFVAVAKALKQNFKAPRRDRLPDGTTRWVADFPASWVVGVQFVVGPGLGSKDTAYAIPYAEINAGGEVLRVFLQREENIGFIMADVFWKNLERYLSTGVIKKSVRQCFWGESRDSE